MTSVINIKYDYVTVESIPQGYCHSVIGFLLAIGLSNNAVHSERRPEYGDKCFARPVIHFGIKSLLSVRESVMGRNNLAVLAAMLF